MRNRRETRSAIRTFLQVLEIRAGSMAAGELTPNKGMSDFCSKFALEVQEPPLNFAPDYLNTSYFVFESLARIGNRGVKNYKS